MSEGGRLWQVQENINELLENGTDVGGINDGKKNFRMLHEEVTDLSVALLSTGLKFCAWRSLCVNNAAPNNVNVPISCFIAGINRKDCKAAIFLNIRKYWGKLRDIGVQELDEAPELTMDDFTHATQRFVEQAFSTNTPLTRDVMDSLNAAIQYPMDVRWKDGRVVIPGVIDEPAAKEADVPAPTPKNVDPVEQTRGRSLTFDGMQ